MNDPSQAMEAAGTRARGRLTDEIYRQISDDILFGRFAPGERLEEVALAQRYGVSRTPVREAIKLLATAGLVVNRPNRGAIVASMGKAELLEIFEAIGELEAVCARHAALRMDEPERTRLREIHEHSRVAMQKRDMEAYVALNVALHDLIIDAAHNAVLREMATGLRQRVAVFRRGQFHDFERMGASFAEHCTLVDALLAGDALAAYREMRAHVLAAQGASLRLPNALRPGNVVD